MAQMARENNKVKPVFWGREDSIFRLDLSGQEGEKRAEGPPPFRVEAGFWWDVIA